MAHPARRRVSLRGLLSALATLLFVAALAAGGWVWFDYRNFSDAPLHIASADATLDIPPGTAFLGIVRRVREGGYSAAPELYWRALAWESKNAQSLHAGEYALTAGLTPRGLLRKMAAGEVIQHRFTIVEGWTFRQLRAALAAEAGVQQTLTTLTDAEVMARLGAAEAGGLLAYVRELHQSHGQLQGELANATAGHAATRQVLQAREVELAALQQARTDLQTVLAAREQEIRNALAEQDSQRAVRAARETEIASLHAHVQALQAELIQLKALTPWQSFLAARRRAKPS